MTTETQSQQLKSLARDYTPLLLVPWFLSSRLATHCTCLTCLQTQRRGTQIGVLPIPQGSPHPCFLPAEAMGGPIRTCLWVEQALERGTNKAQKVSSLFFLAAFPLCLPTTSSLTSLTASHYPSHLQVFPFTIFSWTSVCLSSSLSFRLGPLFLPIMMG